MRSLLALVAAIAMVAAAWYFRPGSGDGGGVLGSSEPLRVVCAPEVASVCQALPDDMVTIEEAGSTAARLLTADSADADAWVTVGPWPQLVAEARQRAGQEPLVGETATVLGRSPLVMVAWEERAAVLAERCGDDLSWRCVGRWAGEPWDEVGGRRGWGTIKPGHRDPATSATGLLVLGQAVSDFLDSTQFSARDLDGDDLLAWLTRLERAVPEFGTANTTPLELMLRDGPGRFDVIGTIQAEAGPLLERSPRAGALTLRYPEPLVVAEAVLAPLGVGGTQDRSMESVDEAGRAALAAAGWQVTGQPLAPGVTPEPRLPEDAGVPPAGVLDALRTRWEEIVR